MLNPLRSWSYARETVALARRAASETGRSAWTIAWDQVMTRRRTGLSRYEYHLYRLYRPEVSDEEKEAYLAERRLRATWRRLNEPRYWWTLDNKLLFHYLCEAEGLPTPAFLGLFDPVFGRTAVGAPLRTAADLARWIREGSFEAPVFKPVEGTEGRLVLVFRGRSSVTTDTLTSLDGTDFSAERLHSFLTDASAMAKELPNQVLRNGTFAFLVQERVRQHPALIELVGETVCCMRIMTLMTSRGEPSIVAAVMKLQGNQSGVDNMAQGSINAWIDPGSGTLGPGRRPNSPIVDGYTSVPETGRRFVGFELPYWAETQSLILKASGLVPWCRCLGWDVAIAEHGPVIMEANTRWSAKLAQACAPHGLVTGELRQLLEAGH
jgi:Sugar-transfer associated ATP-grasp